MILQNNGFYKILRLCCKKSLTVRHSPNYDKIWNLRLLHTQSPTIERERQRETDSTRFLDTVMSWHLLLFLQVRTLNEPKFFELVSQFSAKAKLLIQINVLRGIL